ncbi:SDR family NAD(P)-dependent oxidoreductase [Lysinimonas soli]|uniref:SDR family NAD(P)-dependent oxidoreductase n=1 Tax=Lysinimonas soli TaxID=1074233 RepID=A0ABW0NR53_9MICO
MSWDPRALPSETGRCYVVTGGNAGIGYFTSEQLASTGARVILASRSAPRAERAIASIRARVPGALVDVVPLDLASLGSVADAAARLRELGPIDGLINNAGLVSPSRRRETTVDGLERTIGANFFGHFALTAQLWPSLTEQGRVVGLGSMATRMVRLDADDLLSEHRYRPFRAYGLSKHAVHGFAFELDRRIRAAGSHRLSLLAHPGYAVTGLAAAREGITEQSWLGRAGDRAMGFMAQGKDRGAWPAVRAVLDPDARSGEFYGPARSVAGPPIAIEPVPSSASPQFGAALWNLAEQRTGVSFTV